MRQHAEIAISSNMSNTAGGTVGHRIIDGRLIAEKHHFDFWPIKSTKYSEILVFLAFATLMVGLPAISYKQG